MPVRSFWVCAAVLPLLTGCAQFQLVGTWQNPKANPPPQFSSVVVLTTMRETTSRRIFEDAFVSLAEKRGIRATQGYNVVQESQTTTPQEVEAGVRASGAQAAIVVTVTHSTVVTQTGPTYSTTGPPVWEMGFGGFYSTGWLEWNATSSTSTMEMQLRLNIYDAASQQLVWSGITNTVAQDQVTNQAVPIANMFFEALWSRAILVPAAKQG